MSRRAIRPLRGPHTALGQGTASEMADPIPLPPPPSSHAKARHAPEARSALAPPVGYSPERAGSIDRPAGVHSAGSRPPGLAEVADSGGGIELICLILESF